MEDVLDSSKLFTITVGSALLFSSPRTIIQKYQNLVFVIFHRLSCIIIII